ncbi:hypothetical protein BGW37DRAFT_212988 [Umbelopsis sp. PMI_123]|nr:hypothetical protein BGW37DRAFT_212988 [Umbelopsis sp. PMI_123]
MAEKRDIKYLPLPSNYYRFDKNNSNRTLILIKRFCIMRPREEIKLTEENEDAIFTEVKGKLDIALGNHVSKVLLGVNVSRVHKKKTTFERTLVIENNQDKPMSLYTIQVAIVQDHGRNKVSLCMPLEYKLMDYHVDGIILHLDIPIRTQSSDPVEIWNYLKANDVIHVGDDQVLINQYKCLDLNISGTSLYHGDIAKFKKPKVLDMFQ